MKLTTQLLSLFLIISLTACKSNTTKVSGKGPLIKGSGNVITESRDASVPFSKLVANGSVNVFLKEGPYQLIKVEADDNIVPHVIVENKKGTLILKTERKYRTKNAVNIHVTYKDLNTITSNGSTDVKVESTLNNKNISLTSSGSSNLTVNALEAKSLDVKSNGSSDVKINKANSNNITLNLSGATNFKIAGKTKSLKAKTSGSSNLAANNLLATSAELKSSGSSNITIQVSDKIEVQASGASDIQYIGNPKVVSEKRSGSASIKKK